VIVPVSVLSVCANEVELGIIKYAHKEVLPVANLTCLLMFDAMAKKLPLPLIVAIGKVIPSSVK
jgi:hypothetical protein